MTAPKCVPCRIDAGEFAGSMSTAFLAGVSFAFGYNADAIRARICAMHADRLTRAHAASLEGVRPEDRR